MALKRRVEKTYSIEEMMCIINKDFIDSEHDRPASVEPLRHYILKTTCFKDGDKSRFLMADSRFDDHDAAEEADMLPAFTGSTIEEVVTKCFVAISTWQKKPVEEILDLGTAMIPKPIKRVRIDKMVDEVASISGSRSIF